jgi:hypothetical protein
MKLMNREVKIDEHDGKEATERRNRRIDGKNRWSRRTTMEKLMENNKIGFLVRWRRRVRI